MTIKLYDNSAYETAFTAVVLSSERIDGGYGVVLDQTLFFPTEGGQTHDTGYIEGLPVLDVRLGKDGVITHTLPAPLPIGDTVSGEISWKERFRKMQNHTGEHILSGFADTLYGWKNVGFHLGEDVVTVDYDGVPPNDDYSFLEQLANDAVYRNIPVTVSYPSPLELSYMTYRSKLDLTENVRIVRIGDVDVCACCAPHVHTTGEVGMIKILSAIHYKGGCRLTILCGSDALNDYRDRIRIASDLSHLLSVPENKLDSSVHALYDENARLRQSLFQAEKKNAMLLVDQMPHSDAVAILALDTSDTRISRDAANILKNKAPVAAVLMPRDDGSTAFCLASLRVPLRALYKTLSKSLPLSGGGNDTFLTGVCRLPIADTEAALKKVDICQ